MKNFKLATKITAITLLILAIGLVAVWGLTEVETTSAMKESVVSKLDDSVESRYEIVNSFVEMAEAYLVGYSQAPELTEFFLDMGNQEKLNKLQAYTESYAAVNENLENIYAASVESVVKASVVKPVIGVQLRTGDALKALQDEVFDDNTICPSIHGEATIPMIFSSFVTFWKEANKKESFMIFLQRFLMSVAVFVVTASFAGKMEGIYCE